MAKKSTTPTTMQRVSQYLGDKLGSLDADRKRVLVMRLGQVALCLSIVAAAYVGIDRLQQRVHALDRYAGEMKLEWESLPDWLQVSDNQHILDWLASKITFDPSERPFDPELAERVGQALSAPELAWIASVERVKVRPNGHISVKCEFRRPAAWVKSGKYCYLVDQQGLRLPGRYDAEDCSNSVLKTIVGAAAGPPAVGQIWHGADVASGIKLVAMLSERSFRHQVAEVLINNFNGRSDPAKPHIEITTDRADSRICWGRAPGQEHGTEINASQKLTLLDALYRQWGRIDMNRPYVSVTTWPDRVAMPSSMQPPAQARLLRG